MCVALIARMATALGYHAGFGDHDPNDKQWDPKWRRIIYVDLPNGQVSWHIHDSQWDWFDDLKPYPGQWDGHSTEKKHERLRDYKAPNPRVSQQDRSYEVESLKRELAQITVDLGVSFPDGRVTPAVIRREITQLRSRQESYERGLLEIEKEKAAIIRRRRKAAAAKRRKGK
jgi:hypothetical protein